MTGYIGEDIVELIHKIEMVIGRDETQKYLKNNDIQGLINQLCINLSEEEKEELINLLNQNLTNSFFGEEKSPENEQRIMSLLAKNQHMNFFDILRDYKEHTLHPKNSNFTSIYEYLKKIQNLGGKSDFSIVNLESPEFKDTEFEESHSVSGYTKDLFDRLYRFEEFDDREKLIELLEKEAAYEYLLNEENPEIKEQIEVLLEKVQHRQYDFSDIMTDYFELGDEFSSKYGESTKKYLDWLEIIIGKDILRSYYDNNDVMGIKSELQKHLEEQQCDNLIDLLEKEATYFDDRIGLKSLMSREEKYENGTYMTGIEYFISRLAYQIHDDPNVHLTAEKAIVDYSLLKNVIEFNVGELYWNDLYGSTDLKFFMNQLEIILGQEKIKTIYESDSFEGITSELSKYLTEQELSELYSIIEESINRDRYSSSSISEETANRMKKLISTLCINSKNEGLADIFENINIITRSYGDMSGVNLYYTSDGNIFCSYYSTEENKVYKVIIERSELLKMNNETLIKYIIEMDKEKQEETENTTSEKTENEDTENIQLSSMDLASYSIELLGRGSGGSIVCDAVDLEIHDLIQEDEQKKGGMEI